MKILPQVAKILDFKDGKATCPICKSSLKISIENGHIAHGLNSKCGFMAMSYGMEDDYHFVVHRIAWPNQLADIKKSFRIMLDFHQNKTYLSQLYGDQHFEIDQILDVDFNDQAKLATKFDSLLFYS